MSAVRLAVYDLPAGELLLPAGAVWFVRGAEGVRVDGAALDEAGAVRDTVACAAGATGWLFEAAPASAPAPAAVPVLSRVVEPEGRSLARFDRVGAATGSATPPHRHQGPGLRRLAQGTVLAEIGDDRERIEAGEAWFESGDETVVGRNVGTFDTVFYRLLLLPETLTCGASSFLPVAEAPTAKRNATIHLIGEARLQTAA